MFKVVINKEYQDVFYPGNLHGETDCPARVYEDRFIRRFMEGTFHRMLTAPIGNMI